MCPFSGAQNGPLDPLRPGCPLASVGLRRQKHSAARVRQAFGDVRNRRTVERGGGPPYDGPAVQLRGTVFLPGRRIPLREPKTLPRAPPWTFD